MGPGPASHSLADVLGLGQTAAVAQRLYLALVVPIIGFSNFGPASLVVAGRGFLLAASIPRHRG